MRIAVEEDESAFLVASRSSPLTSFESASTILQFHNDGQAANVTWEVTTYRSFGGSVGSQRIKVNPVTRQILDPRVTQLLFTRAPAIRIEHRQKY